LFLLRAERLDKLGYSTFNASHCNKTDENYFIKSAKVVYKNVFDVSYLFLFTLERASKK